MHSSSTFAAFPATLLPFAILLGAIAFGPIGFPKFWHHHYGKIASLLVVIVLLPLGLIEGFAAVKDLLLHLLFSEYLPFISVLAALYIMAGGVYVHGAGAATPWRNTGLLALGSLLASLIGTTGAAMILIRPLIEMNRNRQHQAHVFVFFIFLVANIGGSLSPIGDPPLFLGFLRGVDFFWPLQHLWPQTLFCAGSLLLIFLALDFWLAEAGDAEIAKTRPTMELQGRVHLMLLALLIATILMCARFNELVGGDIYGASWLDLLRDGTALCLALISLKAGPASARQSNHFNFGPIVEIAILFAAIFVCMAPVLDSLRLGEKGLFAPVFNLLHDGQGQLNPLAFFWASGLLSSVLDNAPTYLAFFQIAGGDAHHLMTDQAALLAAISLGAVFMGAMTYIGNAPNFMVYAIVRHEKAKMPGFFGFLAWSCGILLPIFTLMLIFSWR